MRPSAASTQAQLHHQPRHQPPPQNRAPPVPRPKRHRRSRRIPRLKVTTHTVIPHLSSQPRTNRNRHRPQRRPRKQTQGPTKPHHHRNQPTRRQPTQPTRQHNTQQLSHQRRPTRRNVRGRHHPQPNTPRQAPRRPANQHPHPANHRKQATLIRSHRKGNTRAQQPRPTTQHNRLPKRITRQQPQPTRQTGTTKPIQPTKATLIRPQHARRQAEGQHHRPQRSRRGRPWSTKGPRTPHKSTRPHDRKKGRPTVRSATKAVVRRLTQ